jgi:spermidine synthase
VVFLGSFLLFVSEPLIGRLLLPFLGGGIHIWLICLTFFQGLLLLGYLYAHVVARRIRFWHLLILLLPLIRLPFAVPTEPDPNAPILSLAFVLASRFSLPFAVLSTTVVVVQSWLSQSKVRQFYEPYSLYAASNAGSLTGLLGYAFLIEPQMGVRTQSVAWTVGYICFLALMSITWYCLMRSRHTELAEDVNNSEKESISDPSFTAYGTWILLSSFPSAFLLAVSNFISMEIGSFPLIWVVPLSLYLGSFIVTFRTHGGAPRLLNILWPEILLFASAFYFIGAGGGVLVIFGCLLSFTLICIVAHGRLYELRPPTKWLTNFYLATAFGGFLGGVSVSIVAPLIFNRYYEYLILILLFGGVFWQLRGEIFKRFWIRTSRVIAIARLVFLVVVLLHIALAALPSGEAVKFRYRNFYGTYRISDFIPAGHPQDGIRVLEHGKTVHGAQMLSASLQMTPIYCYYPKGGYPDVYETTPRPLRAAVIGLGAGAICTYVEPRDMLVFFEIDPDNHRIAKEWFTYLSKCKAEVKVISGDGRLSLKNYEENGIRFDIINVDAFSGDGIPVHLLTKEALQTYLSRLADNGVILFHISNRYYHLFPVVKSTIAELNLFGVMNVMLPKEQTGTYQLFPSLVAVAKNPERLKTLINRGWIRFSEKDGLTKVRPWTDDYINVIAPLRETLRMVGLFRLGRPN